MEKPPMEWIDRLFNCMMEFYGERWSKSFTKKEYESLAKIIWQSALQGLTYEEIRDTLVLFKRRAREAKSLPPTHIQFFCTAKGSNKRNTEGTKKPEPAAERKSDPDVARRAISEIRAKLDGDNSLKRAE
jgi:hypothetical protein